jgi:DNA polymerase
MQVDADSLNCCIAIVEQAEKEYTAEISKITNGAVATASQTIRITKWLAEKGVAVGSLDAAAVTSALKRKDIPEDARRVLEIRSILGSSSNLFTYCGAERTGRFAGRGPQPQNLPSGGPKVRQCDPIGGCGKFYASANDKCPWCGTSCSFSNEASWCPEAVEQALSLIQSKSLKTVEFVYGDAVKTVSGCLRGLFCAAKGHELICSDYSAIEAVVLAELAGETWRQEVFRTHGKIYEMSAAKITGIPFNEILEHKARTGEHHPARKTIGKIAELASGYQGSVGAWKAFGADKHVGDDAKILEAVKKWRKDSPAIVNFWYGIERAAQSAVRNPGQTHSYRDIKCIVLDDILAITLLSGRKLYYHSPALTEDMTPWGRKVFRLSHMGWHNTSKKWMRLDTYGGKLTENITQATARDILAHALVNLEREGYPVVLHVHDEVVCEVPEGAGSVEHLENIMGQMPYWAQGWPIKASGGWRGKRFAKD